MKFKQILKKCKRKNLLVDLDKQESINSFKNDLKTKWVFSSDQIDKTLKKYDGQLKKYGTEHASIMYELLERHLRPLSKHERRGYITIKKINYTQLGDSSVTEFLFTCAFNIVLAGTIYTTLSLDLKLIVCYFICIFAPATYFLKTAIKPRFFSEILSTVENNLSDDFDN